MPNDNPLGERGRALENEYFRRADRELLDKARRTSVLDDERHEFGALIVQVAWAEGGVVDGLTAVAAEERALLTRIAHGLKGRTG
jgi:hypothetical protein